MSSSALPSRTANSIHVMKMCQAFAMNGHDVILLAPDLPNLEPKVKDIYQFYGVKQLFTIRKLLWIQTIGKGSFYGFLSALIAKKLKPDLVYGRFIPGCFFSGIMRLPVIFEAHASIESFSAIRRWMFSKLMKRRELKRVVVISNALKQYFQENYRILDNRILVAHDGADIPQKSERISFFRSDRLQVGYIGQLYPGKGMEVVSKLAKALPLIDFHVVGGYDSDITQWKEKTSGLNNIVFHGFIQHAQVDRYRQSFDILLAPFQRKVADFGGSDISEWMSPLKIFEYMSVKRPIISSDLPVIREVLNESNSLLVDPEDINSWIEAIRKLQDPKLREKLSVNAYEDF
ncbi:MAG: glycosyltransferase, partial [Promethearchaeota archaeon]